MAKIDINNITERQKLIIKNGLNTYKYIMDNKEKCDEDFRKVFTDFYLSSQGVMRNPGNNTIFFEKLKHCSKDEALIDIVMYLKYNMLVHFYEFSFATKLLHTVNDKLPIYDSRVRNYLIKNYKIDFKFDKNNIKNEEIIKNKIQKDWDLLVEWYAKFLKSEEGKKWISWFDNEFSTFAYISNVKKVDFIIYACS